VRKQYTSSTACLEVKSHVVVPQYVIESFQNSSSSSSSSSRGGGGGDGDGVGSFVGLEVCAVVSEKYEFSFLISTNRIIP
jgi:hypothetical protein